MTRRHLFTMIMAVVMGLSWVGCTKTRPAGPSFLYMAVGASDATGVGAIPLDKGYVFLIKKELEQHFSPVALLNVGVPGARIKTTKEFVRVTAQTGTRPNLVTVWLGANDLIGGVSSEEFEGDLRFILSALSQNRSTRIVIANLPDLTKLPRFENTTSAHVTMQRVNAFNAIIAKEAGAIQAPVVDLFAEPVESELVFDLDGFHPNNKGHARIAKLFMEVIRPVMGMR